MSIIFNTKICYFLSYCKYYDNKSLLNVQFTIGRELSEQIASTYSLAACTFCVYVHGHVVNGWLWICTSKLHSFVHGLLYFLINFLGYKNQAIFITREDLNSLKVFSKTLKRLHNFIFLVYYIFLRY